jgi:hypothetical protein
MKGNRSWTLVVVLALAAVGPWPRAEATEPKGSGTSKKLIQKSYPVADLVQTLGKGPAGAGGPELLVEAIVAAVKPKSWNSHGGTSTIEGTIDYHPETKALIISQTADVHVRVASLLKALAMLQPKRQASQSACITACSPTPPSQHRQYGHFVLDNVRVNAMGVSCTIRRVRFLYKGDGLDNEVAKCALTGGESEKKADVPRVLTELLEKISAASKEEKAPASRAATCTPACVPATLCPSPVSSCTVSGVTPACPSANPAAGKPGRNPAPSKKADCAENRSPEKPAR